MGLATYRFPTCASDMCAIRRIEKQTYVHPPGKPVGEYCVVCFSLVAFNATTVRTHNCANRIHTTFCVAFGLAANSLLLLPPPTCIWETTQEMSAMRDRRDSAPRSRPPTGPFSRRARPPGCAIFFSDYTQFVLGPISIAGLCNWLRLLHTIPVVR